LHPLVQEANEQPDSVIGLQSLERGRLANPDDAEIGEQLGMKLTGGG